MPLKTITTLPPGGFPYVQPGTGMKFNGMVPFNQQVGAILGHRRGNNLPGADSQTVATDLDAYTCQRLGNDPRFCIDLTQKKTSSNPPQVPDAPHAGAVASLLAGARVIKDAWLGEGREPVDAVLAQRRADTCVKECSADPQTDKEHSHNRIGGFFNKVKAVVAQAVLEQRRIKTRLGLKVEGEDKLGTCDICGCNNELRVWTPMETILEHAVVPLENYPKHCFMRIENQKPTTPTTT